MRQAYVHEADLILHEGIDPATVGAVVTTALCGSWNHEGPCRWPHNNDVDVGAAPARFRTVFVAEPADEAEIRTRIDTALHGAPGWLVASTRSRALDADEQALAERLARTALP